MKVVQAKCPYCGKVRRKEDDLNMSKSFCHNCSKKRHTYAQKYFSSRSVVFSEDGKYVLSRRIINK